MKTMTLPIPSVLPNQVGKKTPQTPARKPTRIPTEWFSVSPTDAKRELERRRNLSGE